MFDADGQPHVAFHYKRNVEKALRTLFSICSGIAADGAVTEGELVALDTWVRDNRHLHNDPDVVDILDATGDILDDGQVTQDELDDMLGLIETVIEYRHEPPVDFDEAVDQLIGIAHGLVADRALNDREVAFLSRWLTESGEICDRWPGSAVRQRVQMALSDGVVTAAEREDLIVGLEQLCGVGEGSGAVAGMSTQLPVTPVEQLEFDGTTFCLTGKFLYGPRRLCERAVVERHGQIAPTLTKKVDVLVIGALASRDWMHTSHGRKIEKAVELREQGHRVHILDEENWARLL